MYQQAPQPDFSSLSGLITQLNNDELKEVLNDDEKFEELLKDFKQYKDFETEKEMIIASNSSLAEFNLAREPELTEGREKLLELSTSGEELSKRIEEKMDELKSKLGDMAPDTALALLQAAAAEMEEESESIASSFLAGDTDVDDFLLQFTEKRKIMHLRKVKIDKMSELVSRQQLMNHVPNYINAPPVSLNTNYFPNMPSSNSVPYPTGPINMPIPRFYPNNY